MILKNNYKEKIGRFFLMWGILALCFFVVIAIGILLIFVFFITQMNY